MNLLSHNPFLLFFFLILEMMHNPRTLHAFVGPNVVFCLMRTLYNAQIRVHTHPRKLIKHPKSSRLPGAMTKAVITGTQRCRITQELLLLSK